MTVTGDWTMVEDSNRNDAMETIETPTTTMQEQSPTKTAAVRFPCMEQPPRYALRSAKTGIYLGGTKKGRLVGRSKRTENDEWTIALVTNRTQTSASSSSSSSQGINSSTVTIHNHKHGNVLSMVLTDKSDLGRMAACVSPSGEEETKVVKENDLGLTPSEEEENKNENKNENENENETEQLADDEDELIMPSNLDMEDMQWCVIRCSEEDHPNGGVVIVSIKTGDCLSVSDSGQIILSPYEPFHVWEMECLTGELCFLSNPSLDARVRCDMAGMLTLSPNWKGWEVVRITEAEAPHSSSGGNYTKGYVRISSWMHSQWFLCSDAQGTVSACSVADALLCPDEAQDTVYRCSKWAIEKYPTDENSKHEGLIIRSVTHGRLLSIQDGLLRTYDSLDATRTATMESYTAISVNSSSVNSNSNGGDIGDMVKHHTEEMKKRTSQWWKQSLTNVQKTISDQAIQRRNSKMMASGQVPVGQLQLQSTGSVPEEETIVWQLESAHLQTYYFISSSDSDTERNHSTPKSIGAFPTVTENLRKSDKIQMVRNDEFPDMLKLFLPDEKYFITCTSKGNILATNQMEDEGLEWILEERETGSVFQSKAHGLFLSFRTEESKAPPAAAFQEGENENENENSAQDAKAKKKKKNPFENIKLPHQRPKPPISELCATESPTIWNLEPCTPRAISSKRLKTFAIGTSIAVGTTIAMPFAIAGVAAAMGALGAEAGIGFGIVAAAATGAEALASVGAIGATAYFCFRPEQNSLGDDLEDESKASNPWSKRPFSNWRKW